MKIKVIKPEPVPDTYEITFTQEELDVAANAIAWLSSKAAFTTDVEKTARHLYEAMGAFESDPQSFKKIIKDATF